ncbi:uncharacterized protein LOC130571080 isoform X2 [Triplophysa rosa]|uniref:uncharacterized protein LOC130571080 isoform X2 n=1 Tax=Triplophysa rosa TaxID=992332 RepID=UPI0025462A23|nr:uncharacterized protein LOC130571080 isoform X2 [Triplophysa rosa]
MGQKFRKSVQPESVDDRSGVNQRASAPSTANRPPSCESDQEDGLSRTRQRSKTWSAVLWILQFRTMFTIFFFISVIWNWLHLYMLELAEHQNDLVQMESLQAKCTGVKLLDWLESLSEWYRRTWTLQEDPCKKYHEVMMVDPILRVPPIKAIEFTIISTITDPLKQIGQGFSEFIRALLDGIPVTLQIPVLLIISAQVVWVCSCAVDPILHAILLWLGGRLYLPPPAVEPRLYLPPPAVEPRLYLPPPAVEPRLYLPPPAVEPRLYLPPPAVEPRLYLPPPAVEPRLYLPPPAVEPRLYLPPPAVEPRLYLPPPAVEPRLYLPPPAVESRHDVRPQRWLMRLHMRSKDSICRPLPDCYMFLVKLPYWKVENNSISSVACARTS